MAEKDTAEKQLFQYADVFANVVNVLLFAGEALIAPEELTDVLPRSTYRGKKGKLREQERDVAKLWKKNKIRIAFLGLENQSDIDKRMPVRVMSYDGAAYRDEMNKKQGELYPVVTLVLYFGYKKHWRKPRRLKDCFEVPERLKKYVSDYRINVIEIAWLPEETIAKFDPTFRVVAEYFSQMRKGEKYRPSESVVQHVKEVLDLMAALTQDVRFIEAGEDVQEGEEYTMRSVMLDRLEDEAKARGLAAGMAEGRVKGRAEGRAEGRVEGRAEGKAEGIAERTLRTIRNQLRRREVYDIIASDNDVTVDEVIRIAKESGLAY